MVQDGAMLPTAGNLRPIRQCPGRYLLAAALMALMFPDQAAAAQPRTVTMQPLTMTGSGGAAPAASSRPFAPKSVSMAMLTMTGVPGSAAPAARQSFSAKTVTLQMLTMTGTRGGLATKLPLGAATLLKLPILGKKP
jgi:hypothetical protein